MMKKILFFAVVCLFIAGCGSQQEDNYEEIASKYIKAKDNKEGMSYCSKDFAACLKGGSKVKKEIESIKIIKSTVEDNKAVVTMKLKEKKGEEKEANIYLILEDNKWKVDDLGIILAGQERKLKTMLKGMKNLFEGMAKGMAEGMKNSFQNQFKKGYDKPLAKQTVKGIEVRIGEIKKQKEISLSLDFFYKTEKKYNHKLFLNGKKQSGYSRTRQYDNVNLNYEITIRKGAYPKNIDTKLVLNESSSLKSATLKKEFKLKENEIKKLSQSLTTKDGIKIDLNYIALLKGKRANNVKFSWDKIEKTIPVGNENLYISKSNSGSYYFLLTGKINNINSINIKDPQDNFKVYNPDKKHFGGKLNMFCRLTKDKTGDFSVSGTLFNKRPKRVIFCFFSQKYYANTEKVFDFKNLDLSKIKEVYKVPKSGSFFGNVISNKNPNDKFLRKSNVGDLEVKLVQIKKYKKVEYNIVLYYKKQKENLKTQIKVNGFKSTGTSSMTMGKLVKLEASIQPETENYPKKIDITIALSPRNKKSNKKIFIFKGIKLE